MFVFAMFETNISKVNLKITLKKIFFEKNVTVKRETVRIGKKPESQTFYFNNFGTFLINNI